MSTDTGNVNSEDKKDVHGMSAKRGTATAQPGGVPPAARGWRCLIAALSALSVTAVLMAAGVAPASAQTFPVNDTSDAPDANLADGKCASTNQTSTHPSCTLRSAMWEAQLVTPAIIDLPPGVFRLTIPPGSEATGPSNVFAGDLDVFNGTDIRINGAGVDATFIDGGNTNRIFDVEAHGTLTLRNLTLENGKADFDGATGHSHGGAIHNHGTLTLSRVAVTNSTATSSTHIWGGGAITNAPGATATLSEVTVAGNSTDAQGGGIENKGTLSMIYTTITDNTAPGPFCRRPGLAPCLVHFGARGGGLWLEAGSKTFLADTIVAGNGGGNDCAGPGQVTSTGGNLQGDGSCPFNDPTDQKGDPLFLVGASGPPRYWPLLPNSPAVDVPTTALCLPGMVDIRNRPRPQDGNGDGVVLCDSGSYELEAGGVPMLSISNARVPEASGATRSCASPSRCRPHPSAPSSGPTPRPATGPPARASTASPKSLGQ